MVGGPDIPAKTYKSKNPQLLDPDIMSDKREAFDWAVFLEAMNQNKKIDKFLLKFFSILI